MSELWTNGSLLIRVPNLRDLGDLIGGPVELQRDRKLAAVEVQAGRATAEAIKAAVGSLGDRLRAFPLLAGLVAPDLDWQGYWRLLRADEFVIFNTGPEQVEGLMDGANGILADLLNDVWVRR